jgi:hypothetical protein
LRDGQRHGRGKVVMEMNAVLENGGVSDVSTRPAGCRRTSGASWPKKSAQTTASGGVATSAVGGPRFGLPRVAKHLVRMIRRIYLRIDLRDVALLVDQIRDSLRIARGCIGAGAIRNSESSLCVAQQRERKVEFLRERRVRRFVVEARAEDRDVLVRELSGSITEPVPL